MQLVLYRRMDQGLYIFWKTRSTITTTRIQEFGSNAGIRADALTYVIYIRPYQLTKISDIIHERDTSSQHRIRRILRHFSGRNIHEQDTEVVDQERLI